MKNFTKYAIITLLILTFTNCGVDNMAQIGVETKQSLALTNVTDDTQYYDDTKLTIGSHLSDTSFIIKDGVLFATGSNTYGQLGIGSTTNEDDFISTGLENVKSIFAGIYTTFVIKNDGTLWASGGVSSPFQIGNIESTTFIEVLIDNVKTMSIGEYHAMIILTDGTLLVSGLNNYGEIGTGDNSPRVSFTKLDISPVSSVSCGFSHTLIIKDGVVFATGLNDNGQLSQGNLTNLNTFTTTSRTANIISSGYKHSLCVSGGDLYSVGDNIAGQLGQGDKVDLDVFTATGDSSVENVYGGWVHSIFIKTNGDLYGAGANNVGQIGMGATAESLSFASIGVNASGLSCGYNHSIAIVSGVAYTTGYNAKGQLGQNDTATRTTFTSTSESVDSFTDETWNYFYNNDIVRNDNYRYNVSITGDEIPTIFTTLTQIGYVNELKPFDDQNITPAISSSPMTYKITGTEEFNSFTLAKVLASSITYIFKNSLGSTIKTETIDIDCKRDENGTLSLYSTTVIYYAGQQMEIGSTVEISLAHSDDIELGDFTLNNTISLGFSNLNFRHKVKDYNDYTPDSWGNIPPAIKAKVTTFTGSLDIYLSRYDYAVNFIESITGKNITIDFSDSDGAVADGITTFSSLTRRGRATFDTGAIVKDGGLYKMANSKLSFVEIV
jgi:alpha-tubulin suppressor-like RCC1 family protein